MMKVSIDIAYGGEDGTEITSGRAWMSGQRLPIRPFRDSG